MDEMKEAIGQKVFIILKSGRKYSGVIRNIENGLIYLIDRRLGKPKAYT